MGGISVFIHVYYPGSWAMIIDRCGPLLRRAQQIIVTACHDDVLAEIGEWHETIREADGASPKGDAASRAGDGAVAPSGATLIKLKVPNKGKDIGGKLAAFACYLRLGHRTEYIALLHDKLSPQSINADYWALQLYSPFTEAALEQGLRMLARDWQVGIIGSKAFLKNEYVPEKGRFESTNDALLRALLKEYEMQCRRYDFIAGTMFIGRSVIFEKLFADHPVLEARAQLEEGNVLDLEGGTYTHCWERLLCFAAEDQGYSIKGI